MQSQRILVTGSEGRLGRIVVQDLRAHGYIVTATDKFSPQRLGVKIVDCEDFGQVISMLRGHTAVIHLAAIPHPLSHPPEVVFRNNVTSVFNVLQATELLGIHNVVIASSISVLGFGFKLHPFNPRQVPIDETHPLLAQDAYGLSKIVGEETASAFCRRVPGLSVASLRFSYVIDDQVREHFFNPTSGRMSLEDAHANVLWTYVDGRDAAAACRLALETALPGHEACYIAAPTTISPIPVEQLLPRYYPGDYPVAPHIRGSASPLDCSKAARLFGWSAHFDWQGKPL